MNNEQLEQQVRKLVAERLQQGSPQDKKSLGKGIPLGISNRHIHLSADDFNSLFGQGASLSKYRDLMQPGEFASNEKVTLVGPKGVFEQVRVLGPLRPKTQVELSMADCIKLGIAAPVRDSGDTANSGGITLVGPKGSVTLPEGCIIATRHIHMSPSDAQHYGCKHGDHVCVKSPGPRGVVFLDVLVRVSEKYKLEMHLDIDEANAASLKNGDLMEIVDINC